MVQTPVDFEVWNNVGCRRSGDHRSDCQAIPVPVRLVARMRLVGARRRVPPAPMTADNARPLIYHGDPSRVGNDRVRRRRDRKPSARIFQGQTDPLTGARLRLDIQLKHQLRPQRTGDRFQRGDRGIEILPILNAAEGRFVDPAATGDVG
jgi:hypothetical protein